MTQEEARAALHAATNAIREAAELLRPHSGLFAAYQRERESMDSIGPIIDQTLWKSPVRRETDAIVGPLFDGAQSFLRIVESQRTRAMEAVMTRGGRDDG